MNKNRDLARSVLALRTARGWSQVELSRRAGWAQAKVSRVEHGKRSVTVHELLELARVFSCPVDEVLGQALRKETGADESRAALSPGFFAARESEDVLLAQLARLGVRFLGSAPRPSLVALPAEETLLAALGRADDPRIFETLPALLVGHARRMDMTKLVSAAYSLRLQNRLGMALAAAL